MEPPSRLRRALDRFFASAVEDLGVDRARLERLWADACRAEPGERAETRPCDHILSRGPRKGLHCAGKPVSGTHRCRKHKHRPKAPGKQKMVFRPLAGSPDILVNDRTGFVLRTVEEGVLGRYDQGSLSSLSEEASTLCRSLGLGICEKPPPLDSLLLES